MAAYCNLFGWQYLQLCNIMQSAISGLMSSNVALSAMAIGVIFRRLAVVFGWCG